MLIGVCQVELLIPASESLKAKRYVIQSLKTRIKNKFNVSISEVDYNDKWQRAVLGMALVTNEKKFIDKTFNQILNLIDIEDQVEVINHQLEVI
jgi:uncharacterized protein